MMLLTEHIHVYGENVQFRFENTSWVGTSLNILSTHLLFKHKIKNK